MPAWSMVGLLNESRPLWPWLLATAKEELLPTLQNFAADPTGVISRVGDVLVWQGESGSKMILGLESIGEQANRIENAVSGIESAQLATQGTLGVVQAVSLATLGVSSLSAGFMAWRLHSLNVRLDRVCRKLDDVDRKVEAGNIAYLKSSIQFLGEFEKRNRAGDLENAFEKARQATNIYGDLSQDEAQSQKRLPLLNYRSRCYVLALLTEMECLVLREDQEAALERALHERERLKLLASVTFCETIAKSPEAYLDPHMKSEGITLELMTEAYQQAWHAGAIDDKMIVDAGQMFEEVRSNIFRRRRGSWWVWRPVGAAKKRYAQRLRYLLACVEDINRVESLRLLLAEADARALKVRDLLDSVRTWRSECANELGDSSPGVLAYTIA